MNTNHFNLSVNVTMVKTLVYTLILLLAACKEATKHPLARNPGIKETQKSTLISDAKDQSNDRVIFILEKRLSDHQAFGLADDPDISKILAYVMPAVVTGAAGAVIAKLSSVRELKQKKRDFDSLKQRHQKRVKDLKDELLSRGKIHEEELARLQERVGNDASKLEELALLQERVRSDADKIKAYEANILDYQQSLASLKDQNKLVTDDLEKAKNNLEIERQRAKLAYKRLKEDLERETDVKLSRQKDQLNDERRQVEDRHKKDLKDKSNELELLRKAKEEAELRADIAKKDLETHERRSKEKEAKLELNIAQLKNADKKLKKGDVEEEGLGLNPDYRDFTISELELKKKQLDLAIAEYKDQLKNISEMTDENLRLRRQNRLLIKDRKNFQDHTVTTLGLYSLTEKITAISYESIDSISLVERSLLSRDVAYAVFSNKRMDILDHLKEKYYVEENLEVMPDVISSDLKDVKVVKITSIERVHEKSKNLIDYQSNQARGIRDFNKDADFDVVGDLGGGSVYRMSKKIGKGSFGSVRLVDVYRANGQQSHFAMKIFEDDASFEAAKKVLDETTNFIGDHQNLLKSYGTIKDMNGKNAILYEAGGSNLSTAGPGLNEMILAFVDIIDGVSYIHSKQRMHWDLKPANMVMGYDGRVKIIDLDGITPIPSRDDPSKFPKALHTWIYTAPEFNFKDKLGYTKDGHIYDRTKSDVYSVGMSMLEIRAGKKIPKIFEEVMKKRIDSGPEFRGKREPHLDFQVNFLEKLRSSKYRADFAPEMAVILDMIHPDPQSRISLEAAKKRLLELPRPPFK